MAIPVEKPGAAESASVAEGNEVSERRGLTRPQLWILAAWLGFVGGYAVLWLVASSGLVPGLAPGSWRLAAIGNILQCIVPLFANAGLLLNAASPHRRWNVFWMLLALGCTLWLIAQIMWSYAELVLSRPAQVPFGGDVIFFLQTVPMIGAMAMQPHARRVGHALRYGYFDLFLLGAWWVYLYAFFVLPHEVVFADAERYIERYSQVFAAENVVFLAGVAYFIARTSGGWRMTYANLFGAGLLYFLGSQEINRAIGRGTYYTGSWYDIPVVASFVWFGTAGIVAYGKKLTPLPADERHRSTGMWPARTAMACVLSMPLLALWTLLISDTAAEITRFRLLLTLGSIVGGSALVFLRQHLVDRERLRLLRASQESLENLRRLQAQFVQSEKLASLGQLAAGAAHEINNPLTAIMGYTDLLLDDESLGERQKSLLGKLREQARRTKTLVNNLLSFARQVPAEKALLDINAIVNSALQLRTLDLRDKSIRIELQTESVVPGVRGDPNQLLQVFFNVISNAVDAMEETGGGVLTVRTVRERANVVIEFSDTGPGMKEAHLVFDPFYTTKPVGKGTGLGLSICYGIVQEHSGRITAYNRPSGGATFRVELPAVIALLPHVRPPSPPRKEP